MVRVRKTWFRPVWFFVALLSWSASLEAQQCDDILSEGLFEQTTYSDNSTVSDSAYFYICSNRSRSSSSANTFGIKIPLKEVAGVLGLSSSNDVTRQSVDRFCQSGGQSTERGAAINFAKSVVSPKIVDAWSTCMSQASGLSCAAEPVTGSHFSVTISWERQNIGEGTEAVTITGQPQYANAICDGSVSFDGLVIPDDSSSSAICSYDDASQPAMLIFNSTQGSLRCLVPAIESEQSFEEITEVCAGGEVDACLAVIAESREVMQLCEDSSLGYQFDVNCANAATLLPTLLKRVAEVDASCWQGGASCSAAKERLSPAVISSSAIIDAIRAGETRIVGSQ